MSFIFQICYLPLCTSLRLCSFALAAGHWKKNLRHWPGPLRTCLKNFLGSLHCERVGSTLRRFVCLRFLLHRTAELFMTTLFTRLSEWAAEWGTRERRDDVWPLQQDQISFFLCATKAKKNVSTFSVVSFHSPLSFGLALKSESLIA